MKTLFDFFEELDEMIYISDMDTHELVYMNRHLRESLGYSAHKSYKGKKCYDVLQNGVSPCTFCNNDNLNSGKFLTWMHENPVLGQKVVVKDSMIVADGRRYRIEIAVQVGNKEMVYDSHFYTRRESVINECMQYFFATPNPEESLDMLLAYLGETFQCDRTYIFEIYRDETASNTYEWCKKGINPQKNILQNQPVSDVAYWMTKFREKESVIIKDLEDICTMYPSTYSLLHPQGITSLIAVPIYDGDSLKGFIGMDNPYEGTFLLLKQVVESLAEVLTMQLKRGSLFKRFNEMSYQDLLTGAYNRNALVEHNSITSNTYKWKSFGVVYCDINGLKEINDTQGHDAGNKLIQECYRILEDTLDTEWIYRIGGDEFVALYHNVGKEKIEEDVKRLKLVIMQSYCQVSVGYAWSNQQPIDMDETINKADSMMYEEKEKYYEHLEVSEADFLPKIKDKQPSFSAQNISDFQMKLQRFLSNTYCDIPFLLEMLSNNNTTSYFFFGDMQRNLYFISDNLREKFGFESNIVSDLISEWAGRIHDSNLLKRFWKDIHALLEKKQTSHNLLYQIEDVNGNHIWVQCFARVKWSEDGTKPLFFAGRLTHQDESFTVDSITNFLTEAVLIRKLEDLAEQNHRCQAIGFSFHNMAQINNSFGRKFGDELIQEICKKLYMQFSGQMTFYRLSGMRCLALIEEPLEAAEEIIRGIKGIIEQEYKHKGLTMQHPCSFALLHYPSEHGFSPRDFIENMMTLVKVAQHEPTQLYVDNSNNNIQQMQELANMEMRLIEDIIHGMENFRIVIQPIVAANGGESIGGETLIRWRFGGNNISPAVFIPIIERENMMHKVGRWVFEQAVRVCIRILSYSDAFYLTVNVSLQQLNDNGFVDFIKQTLRKYRLDGKHIVIELTESCMDEQSEKLDAFVAACTEMGIRIALDDFGSGYSSLRVLLQYPSSIIKLDRTLLLEMSDSVEKSNFITSIVYACHQFGKKVCMEGVETEFQNHLVKEAGCDMIQGFYYYKPIEVEQIYQLLAEKYQKEEKK